MYIYIERQRERDLPRLLLRRIDNRGQIYAVFWTHVHIEIIQRPLAGIVRACVFVCVCTILPLEARRTLRLQM